MRIPLRVLLFALFSGSIALRSLFPADSPALPTAPTVPPDKAVAQKEQTMVAQAPAKHDASVRLYWQAMKIFRDGKAPDWEHGRALLQEAADGEDSTAQNQLGTCYLGGSFGFKKDAQKAIGWFHLAADRGNAFAKVNLGQCYFIGIGVPKDHVQAAALLNAAVASDADYAAPEPPADFFTKLEKKAAEGDETLSADLPVKPADQTRAGAHFMLGEIATEANNLPLAQDHYVKAATMGDAGRAGVYLAATKAATNYAFGKGVPRDLTKANEMLDLSKKLSRRMWTAFAHNLVQEKGLDDFAQADVEDAISTAAEKAQHQIQFDIAGSFADPKSKDFDAREAAKWYELAAEGGETWGMLSLAFLYHDGSLGEPDSVKTFHWFQQAAEKGNKMLGYANLAICYQNGLGTPKDPEKAAVICKTYRNDDFICYLGSIGHCPESILTFDEELALNLAWEKKNHDAQAQYLLGQRYLNGWGVKADFADAIRWFKMAADGGNSNALCELGRLYERSGFRMGCGSMGECYEHAVGCFQRSADAGDPNAMASLADCYTNGHGVRSDINRAAALLEKCLQVEPSLAWAHNNLAVIYEGLLVHALATGQRDSSTDSLREKMLQHYREAERLGFALAARNLGFLAYNGKLINQDFREAYVRFDTAAERGMPEAHRMLGQMHENGEGVPITYRDAAYHYRLAALGGDIEALKRLCNFYLTGKGVAQDNDHALFWLGALVQRTHNMKDVIAYGDVLIKKGDYAAGRKLFESLLESDTLWIQGTAYDRLSQVYHQGLGVAPDQSKAVKYRKKAVRAGNEAALYAAALDLIQQGKRSEAFPMIEKAAEKGLPQANYCLGDIYFRGDGVPKDEKMGLGLIRKAAKAGNVDAEFSLASATLQHLPGAPDLDEAIRLAETAEACGHPQAKTVREKLEALREKPLTESSSPTGRSM
jgi:uncharacterized protein